MKLRLHLAIATLWLVLFALAAPARADELPPGHLRYRIFGGADGLRNLVISSIAQDAHGLIWVTTDEGVYRFDGERFSHFSIAEGLRSTMSFAIGIGTDGEPCVGGIDGLACWDGTRFSQATTSGVSTRAISVMLSFRGKLWVGTEKHGLYVQDGAEGYIPAPGWPRSSTAVRALWADDRGLLVSDGATVRATSGDGTWRLLSDVGASGDPVLGLLRDPGGAVWMRTTNHMWVLP